MTGTLTHDARNAGQLAVPADHVRQTLRDHAISIRHLQRLVSVEDAGPAPLVPDLDDPLITVGLLALLPDGSVEVGQLYRRHRTLVFAHSSGLPGQLCRCTDCGRNQALMTCPECRGEGMVQG